MKTNFIYQGYFKKIFGLILVGIIYFSSFINVYASVLTIENVSKQFAQSTIIEGFAQLGSTFSSKVNTTDKTLDIYSEEEKVFSFVYGDDYIEYNNRSAVVTEENCMDDFATFFWLSSIMESIFVLSGYENKTLSDEDENKDVFTDTYDKYGIQLETESYNFSGEHENGGSWSKSGDYVKYFKMSLDTDKIDALIAKFGVDVDEQDPNKEIIANLTPTLEAKNITENSATIHPKVNYYNTDPDYRVNCFIYRSDREDGLYEKISDWAVNCLDSVGIVDEGLKSNTTYYYKAIVDGGNNFSDPLSVTTKGSSTVVDNNTNNNSNNSNNNNSNNNSNNNFQENVTENPQTGIIFSFIAIISIIFGCVVTMFCFGKYDYNRLYND